MISRAQHDRMANAIRALAMDAIEQAQSGHPGLPLGAADFATVLFTRALKFDASDPTWLDRDRFVLSAGHGSMLLYALLYLTGYAGVTIDQIKRFRQLGSLTPGHPEVGLTPGVETTTGPLGQGLANGVGMAIAERHLAAEFGPEIVDHRTYVLASDGDLMEGISHEAISLAGHLRLNKLIVLYDENRVSIDGPLLLSDSVDQVQRFKAAGWAATRIDGHDPAVVASALAAARASDLPSLIACRTIIAFGAPTKAGTEGSHGAPLGAEEVAGTRVDLNWPYPPYEIPEDVLQAWRAAGQRSEPAREAWERRYAAMPADKRAEFERRIRGEVPRERLQAAVHKVKERLAAEPKNIATRAASGLALETLVSTFPELVGGSADLTGSNNTKVKGMPVLTAAFPGGRYIHYGIREHAHGRGDERDGPAWRHHPLFRDLPRLFRLLPSLAAPRLHDASARHSRDDARLHRDRRRRPDPSSGGTAGRVARHTRPAGLPSLRHGRDHRVLGARAAIRQSAEHPVADAPERAATAQDLRCG